MPSPAIHPQLHDVQFAPNGDRLLVRRNATTGGPSTIPAGAVLFEVCFELLGDEGELADVALVPPASGGFRFEDGGGAVTARTSDGGILISAGAFGVFAEALPGCGGEDANAFRVKAFGGTAPYTVRYGTVGAGATDGPIALERRRRVRRHARGLAARRLPRRGDGRGRPGGGDDLPAHR